MRHAPETVIGESAQAEAPEAAPQQDRNLGGKDRHQHVNDQWYRRQPREQSEHEERAADNFNYSDERGHPRLRLRHLPFHIGREERDHWLAHMTAAVHDATADLPDGAAVAADLLAYFNPAAEQMRNDTGLPISSARN